ncbi:MAG: DUF2029 domain-containing protein [Clostridia bacterium]|nr:DUF2029 domain-containing protein [Clostridia bacterium]
MDKKPTAAKNNASIFITIFVILFALCIAAMLVMAVITRGASFTATLFHSDDTYNKDFFMDFFNSIRDASSMDVYKKGVIYPPLANLLFFALSKLISPSVTGTSFTQRYAMQVNQQAIVIYFLFAILCVAALSFIIKYYLKSKQNKAWAEVLSFLFLFFYPFYYCIERGNIILLAMIFSAFFVFFHDSESKTARRASYILLGAAAGLKIYPAFFGLILLQKKRYKAALRTMVYGLLFFFVPFLFYHFGADFFTFLENVFGFSSENKQHFTFGSVSVMNVFYYLSDKYVPLGKVLFVLTELVAVAAVFTVPKDWQRYALIAYMIVNIKSVSSSYALIFFIIPFVVFLSRSTKKRGVDWFYFLLFCLILLPLPCFYYFHPEIIQPFFSSMGLPVVLNLNQVIALPVVQAMYLFLCLEALINFIHKVKAGQKPLSFFYQKPKMKKA